LGGPLLVKVCSGKCFLGGGDVQAIGGGIAFALLPRVPPFSWRFYEVTHEASTFGWQSSLRHSWPRWQQYWAAEPAAKRCRSETVGTRLATKGGQLPCAPPRKPTGAWSKAKRPRAAPASSRPDCCRSGKVTARTTRMVERGLEVHRDADQRQGRAHRRPRSRGPTATQLRDQYQHHGPARAAGREDKYKKVDP